MGYTAGTKNRIAIDLLEFLVAEIIIHLTLKSTELPWQIFAFPNKSSALGWLYKANFK